MEQYELDLIEKYRHQDEELNRLWEEHLEYERKVNKLERKLALTPEEELELKQLKKLKLAGKTKILIILNKYKDMEEE
ncbi:MAG: DUF465 domain-containing protein [Desulfonauticus sp.]|nr:DUF465 domain-containing protein [Desulfonauticus sp.]